MLWQLSENIGLPSGVLVWLMVGGNTVGVLLSLVVGRKLVGLEYDNQAVEATFRKELVRATLHVLDDSFRLCVASLVIRTAG